MRYVGRSPNASGGADGQSPKLRTFWNGLGQSYPSKSRLGETAIHNHLPQPREGASLTDPAAVQFLGEQTGDLFPSDETISSLSEQLNRLREPCTTVAVARAEVVPVRIDVEAAADAAGREQIAGLGLPTSETSPQ